MSFPCGPVCCLRELRDQDGLRGEQTLDKPERSCAGGLDAEHSPSSGPHRPLGSGGDMVRGFRPLPRLVGQRWKVMSHVVSDVVSRALLCPARSVLVSPLFSFFPTQQTHHLSSHLLVEGCLESPVPHGTDLSHPARGG